MNIIKSLVEKSRNREAQLKKEEVDDVINVSIVDGKLMIVIRNYSYSVALDPSLFKDDNIEIIIRKIREDNYAKFKT